MHLISAIKINIESNVQVGTSPKWKVSVFYETTLVSSLFLIKDECGIGEDVSLRICGYWIDVPYQGSVLEFIALPQVLEFCKQRNIKVLYWTHRTNLSQLESYHRSNNDCRFYTNTDLYKSFVLDTSLVFYDKDKKREYYIFRKKLEENYHWVPTTSKFRQRLHNGEIF